MKQLMKFEFSVNEAFINAAPLGSKTIKNPQESQHGPPGYQEWQPRNEDQIRKCCFKMTIFWG